MNHGNVINALEAEWAPDSGFFACIRQGQFSPSDFERTRAKLAALNIAETADFPRRLVSLLWLMPSVMEWNADRVRESGADMRVYQRALSAITQEVERLLGVP